MKRLQTPTHVRPQLYTPFQYFSLHNFPDEKKRTLYCYMCIYRMSLMALLKNHFRFDIVVKIDDAKQNKQYIITLCVYFIHLCIYRLLASTEPSILL